MGDVFLDVIAPVLLVAGVGGYFARRFGMQVGPLAQLSFFVLSPALVYHSLSRIEASASDAARIAAAVVVAYVAMITFSYGLASVVGLDRRMRSAFSLSASTANSANMGLPISYLAFGDEGLEIAVIAFVVVSVVTNSLGVVVASLAGGSARRALVAPLLVPSLWAGVLGLAVNAGEVELHETLEVSIETLRDAAIPMMLVVLGIHVGSRPGLRPVVPLGLAVSLRLLAGPVVAWGAVTLLGVEGVAGDTLILLGGMPTAVVTSIIATQFQTRPDFVTRAVIASTVASMATLTVLISVLD